MLSRMPRRLLIIALLFVVGCGGRGASMAETAAQERVNVDSLLVVMAERYDVLCAERKVAYREHDPERRRELLERNDAACKALEDSLKWVISIKDRDLTH